MIATNPIKTLTKAQKRTQGVPPLTPAQFEALSALVSAHEGPTRVAARMVFVDGASRSEAQMVCGVTQSTLHQTIERFAAKYQLAKIVCD